MTTNKTAHPWLIWLITSLFSFFQFFLQISSNMMAAQYAASFHLTDTGVGLLSSAFFYTYAAIQIPAGILLDRFNLRRVLIFAAALCGLGCLLFALSPNFILAFISRLIMGAGAGFAFVGMIVACANYFPKSQFPLMVGLAELTGMLGTSICEHFVPYIVLHFGWRAVILGCAAISLLILLGQYLWLHDRDKAIQHTISLPKQIWHNLIAAARIGNVWLAGIFGCGLFAIVSAFAALWAVPYLQNAQQFTYLEATAAVSYTLFGVAIGAPLMGWIVGKTGHLKTTMIIANLLAIITLLSTMWLVHSVVLTELLLFILGICAGASLLAYSATEHSTPAAIRGTGIGLCNGLVLTGAVILQPLIGGSITHLQRLGSWQTTSVYQAALMLVPLILIIALFAVSFIKLKNFRNPAN
jgi:MFS family permease